MNPISRKFSAGFYLGLVLVMLSLWMWFIPDWPTFIHSWRVELFASVFLFITLLFVFVRARNFDGRITFSKDELRFIILPLLAFILWSSASVVWAPSWKSAVHHTLVWSAYLIFYCIVRYLLEQKGQYRRFLYVFTAALLFYALPAIAGFVALSLFGGANRLGIGYATFGEQVLSLLPLVLIAIVNLRRRRFILGVVVATSLCLLIVSTFGRTNYFLFALGTAATGSVIFVFRRFHIYRARFALTAATMVVAALAANSLPMFSVAEVKPETHRFRDTASITASNNFRKLMTSLSIEMISAHPVIGIGADNFGFEVNRYREAYGVRHPDDPNLGAAESEIPERAHNEYLQIFAELGAIGFAIFAWFLVGLLVLGIRLLRRYDYYPLHAYGALIGLGLFLASSLVTSYSFRLIQNGFVFFFVLALAVTLIFRNKDREPARATLSPTSLRFGSAAGMIACVLFIAYCSTRVASAIIANQANATQDLDAAAFKYQTAIAIDNENPRALESLGMRLLHNGRYAEAADYLSRSVEMGLGTSTDFSYLASAYGLAGDNAAAEITMRRASLFYPRSAFVLARYSALLKENGKDEEAAQALSRAMEIDPRAAKTWYSMVTAGTKATSDRSAYDKDIIPVMELVPTPAIYAVTTERLIRFPEERKFSLLKVGPQ
jgi:O-antigen ligase/Tfp pilus assembly protein PilF